MNQRSAGLVYVLETDSAVRDGLRAMLSSHGYEVTSFDSAEDFLASEPCAHPACILTEIDLPGLGAIELLQRLKGDNRPIPMIVMASRSKVSTAVNAMRAGAVDFLEKPFSQTRLLERIHELLPVAESKAQLK